MNKKAILTTVFLTVLVFLFPGFVHGAIPASERAALIALYNSTNGAGWTNKTGWKTPPLHTDGFAMPGTEGNWHGIFLSGDHVNTVNLHENQLHGSIPLELGNLSKLIELHLEHNQLSGSIPADLGNFSNLKRLYLEVNQLSGSIPYQLGNLSQLEYLNLVENSLSGSIPYQLGNLSNLKYLYLWDNQLSGSIPSQLGNLKNLQSLNLSINQLSGIIPVELGNLSNLESLRLDVNQLSGSIPAQLGNLSSLMRLDLSGNQLSGSIPFELGNLYNLEYLLLHNNKLSGVIPSSLINLTKISYFGIGYNCLYATDSELIAWLNTYDPDWESTQCLKEEPPFGSFETPIDGSTVCSSIPVTGWALDDFGMDSVKIYCEQDNTLVFIGDAVFIEGARPDIEQAYPDYPNNYKAGWGYMLLSNFLPGGGNGTYTLIAKATDMEGNEVTLGSKTINVDNAHAVKPFGAIDTPGQGGSATGSAFRNWGWVLTPQPNNIPTDGSTIDVWVDGVKEGHPTYNIYRSDVASLFPGYANSNGAAGYFDFDTTAYENGVHSIFWTAADSGGNSDGIGSRYFTIQNLGTGRCADYKKFLEVQEPFYQKGSWPPEALSLRRGYNPESEPEILSPDEKGMFTVEIRELERIVIYLGDFESESDWGEYKIRPYKGFPISPRGGPDEAVSKLLKRIESGMRAGTETRPYKEFHDFRNTQHLTLKNTPSNHYQGYLVSGDRLKPLPIGSTLDGERGIFYWQPGPGFLGQYTLVFVSTEPNGETFTNFIDIRIVPKFKPAAASPGDR